MAAFCMGATRQHSTTAHLQHKSNSCSIRGRAVQSRAGQQTTTGGLLLQALLFSPSPRPHCQALHSGPTKGPSCISAEATLKGHSAWRVRAT